MSDGFDLGAYVARIGFTGALQPTLATLTALHRAHGAALPFDGIDPLIGRPVLLDMAAVQAKLVEGRRGGYCFEQNTLFKAALEAIGFTVTGLAARVRWMSPPDSPLGPREHMLLKVDVAEGAFIADVGFGACVMDTPLALVTDTEQATLMGTFRLSTHDGHYFLSAKQPDGWRVMYAFTLEPQLQADYDLGNWYTSTSPVPPFRHVLILERVEADKRYKLLNRRFIVEARDGVVVEERVLDTAEAFGDILETVFLIIPPIPAGELFARVAG